MSNIISNRSIELIDESREAKIERVVSGSCSLEEYKYLCGEIHGLDLARDHIKTVLKKVEDLEDD
jgi:hypothetical protein